jgi:hypothetical protein
MAMRLAAIGVRLAPDNLPPIPPHIVASGGVVTCITNPSDLVAVRGCSLAAGHLIDAGAWERPRSGVPDGAYALFRSDEAFVEIISDTVASRTVWYAMTDQLFVAATSQRAIVALLGSFEFNQAVIPWMLVNGTLGPGLSWDKRIRCVPGATSLVLDRMAWTLNSYTEPVVFTPDPASESEHYRRVVAALRHAIGAARVADSQWAIALSGGMDCRTILCCLKDTQGLRGVTWGLRASRKDKSNDAYIAPLLARHFGLDHRYFETDRSAEPLERIFQRFIVNGEGRIDHVSAYMDGFDLWRKLAGSGVQGVIRGDHCFGRPAVHTPLEVRSIVGFLRWSDVPGLPPLDQFDLPAQEQPDWMEQRAAESLESWRDRMAQQYRVPFCLGALADLKLSYVELANPLLSNSVVELIRRLPDTLRTNKVLLRGIAKQLSPPIPFARTIAVQSGKDVLRTRQAVELLRDSLSGSGAGPAVPPELAAYAVNAMAESPAKRRLTVGRRVRRAIKARTPSWVLPKRPKKEVPSPSLDGHRFAFRTYLVSQAARLLSDDADCLQ